ncbi:MAG TPA: hypothetical protein VNH11_03640 [Pirellulales bacterium]|nr:hypothetical protein [Pirellulales bacterium]
MEMDDRFEWRETYFILFPSAQRPSLKQVEKAVRKLGSHFELSGEEADEKGLIECLHIRSPEDHSALEIDYLSGDEVLVQIEELTRELRGDKAEREKLGKLKGCDARFEIMHFEEMGDAYGEETDEVFDPSALLVVLDALVELTGGVGVDPQSGTLLQ